MNDVTQKYVNILHLTWESPTLLWTFKLLMMAVENSLNAYVYETALRRYGSKLKGSGCLYFDCLQYQPSNLMDYLCANTVIGGNICIWLPKLNVLDGHIIYPRWSVTDRGRFLCDDSYIYIFRQQHNLYTCSLGINLCSKKKSGSNNATYVSSNLNALHVQLLFKYYK